MVKPREYKASFRKGKLEITPHVEKKANGNVIIHMISPNRIQRFKNEIAMKIARGEEVELDFDDRKKTEDGKRNLQ